MAEKYAFELRRQPPMDPYYNRLLVPGIRIHDSRYSQVVAVIYYDEPIHKVTATMFSAHGPLRSEETIIQSFFIPVGVSKKGDILETMEESLSSVLWELRNRRHSQRRVVDLRTR